MNVTKTQTNIREWNKRLVNIRKTVAESNQANENDKQEVIAILDEIKNLTNEITNSDKGIKVFDCNFINDALRKIEFALKINVSRMLNNDSEDWESESIYIEANNIKKKLKDINSVEPRQYGLFQRVKNGFDFDGETIGVISAIITAVIVIVLCATKRDDEHIDLISTVVGLLVNVVLWFVVRPVWNRFRVLREFDGEEGNKKANEQPLGLEDIKVIKDCTEIKNNNLGYRVVKEYRNSDDRQEFRKNRIFQLGAQGKIQENDAQIKREIRKRSKAAIKYGYKWQWIMIIVIVILCTVATAGFSVVVFNNGKKEAERISVSIVEGSSELLIENGVVKGIKDGINKSKIEELYIPTKFHGEEVTIIEKGAFADCSQLKYIIIPNSIEFIGENAFIGTAMPVDEQGVIYAGDIKGSKIDKHKIENVNSCLWAVGIKQDSKLLWENITAREIRIEYVLRDGTVGIADGVFLNTAISSIKFSPELKYINGERFQNTKTLNNITITSNTSIKFNGSSSINVITQLFTAQEDSLLTLNLPAQLYTEYNQSLAKKNNIEIKPWVATGKALVLFHCEQESSFYKFAYECDTNITLEEIISDIQNVAENYCNDKYPQKEGYHAVWLNHNETEQFDLSYQLAAQQYDVDLKWMANNYTLVFDPNGGNGAMASAILTYDEAHNLEANQFTRVGYTFQGWNLDGTDILYGEEDSVKNLSSQNNGLVTLCAQWLPNSYVVEFERGVGGVGSMLPQEFKYDDGQRLAMNTFTKEGYTFNGWNTSFNGNGHMLVDGEKADNLTEEVNGRVTLYAQWIPNNYKILFNINCNGDEQTIVQSFKYDVEQELFANYFVRKGYSFMQWNTQSSGIGVPYADREKVKNLTQEPDGTFILYAQWTANTYTVEFDGGEGVIGIMESQTFQFDDDKKLSTNEFVKEGYAFNGWSTNRDGSGLFREDGAKADNLTAEEDGRVTLYAQWLPNNYKILFNINCNGDEQTIVQSFKYDVEQELFANYFVRKGYSFMQWNTQSSGIGVPYADREKVKNLTQEPDGTFILYAQWTANTYTVEFDGGEGVIGIMESQTFQFDDDKKLSTNEFVKEGYAFNGWSTNRDGSGLFREDGAKADNLTAKEDGKVTLFAQWIPNEYKIIFDSNFNSVTGALSGNAKGDMENLLCTYDEVSNLPNNQFILNGWAYQGWAVDPKGNVVFEDGCNIKNLTSEKNGEIILYAVWAIDVQTVGMYVKTNTTVVNSTGTSSYVVYNTIDSIPWSTQGRVIIDWRKETNTNLLDHQGRKVYEGRFNNLDIGNTTSEIIFIGKKSQIFSNFIMHICMFANGQELLMRFIDFNYITNETAAITTWQDGGVSLTLDVQGDCSIGSSCASGNIISDINNLTLTGMGKVSLTAGNGANGWAGNSVTIGDNDYNKTPGNGGNGGNGGIAVRCQYLTINFVGEMTIIGGKGGDGGNGGNVNGQSNSSGQPQLPSGGHGGNGGNGGMPLEIESCIIVAYNIIVFRVGDGGKGGNGGKGGDAEERTKVQPDHGGHGGNGGAGGSGYNGGKGGNGGAGGHSFGAQGDYVWQKLKGTPGNGGDAGKGGNSLSGIIYSNESWEKDVGDVGGHGDVGPGGSADYTPGAVSVSPGNEGHESSDGEKDDSYFYEIVRAITLA